MSDLPCFLLSTEFASYTPLTTWYLTHGRSFTLQPLTRTTLCSCKVCLSPGIYATTSLQFESLTLAIFLWAELGFLGVVTVTLRHTPLLKGLGRSTFLLFFKVFVLYWSAGALDFWVFGLLRFLTSWVIVGIPIILFWVKKIVRLYFLTLWAVFVQVTVGRYRGYRNECKGKLIVQKIVLTNISWYISICNNSIYIHHFNEHTFIYN